ncbi:amidohydrolase [Emticicia agri]|uniref:Amidohydrolase n=1 Tax=Emticicia agri TaxID=2492393 RepID=A0A4Q5M4A0_9BACT|nr:amidohydrolase [Emticicia agri]RYU97276.1 amidohydrolase [Emticicia agri]
MRNLLISLLTVSCSVAIGQSALKPKINIAADGLEKKVVTWRRDFHENPELGNLEFRTAKIVADHLRSLGIEVQEKVGVTGVVGILKGGKPGPVVALRADMDGLPVTERVDVPFKSKVMTEYNGQKTGVMHACGHDSHVAILMGVAEILTSMKNDLAGTVKFIFQPAEEGVYDAKLLKDGKSGAELMVMEGVMENPKVDAIFGLHISSVTEVGKIGYRPGATMAAVDQLGIKLKGKQTHGANPWSGIDPIVTAAQIVMGLQTIVSRNVNITENPAIVTVGAIHGGIRQNIIPESLEMIGTIRTFGTEQRQLVHRRINEVATNIAESAGATADVKIETGYPVTYNDPALTDKMIGTLEAIAGKENVNVQPVQTGAEDFSFFQQKVPGLFFFLGGKPKGQSNPAPHHTPDFYIDESGFTLGMKSLASLTVDYFEMNAVKSTDLQASKGKKDKKSK